MYPQTPADQAKLRNAESPRLRRVRASRTRRRLYTLLYLALILAGTVMLIGSERLQDLPTGVAAPVLGTFVAGFVAVFLLVTHLNRATRMSLPHRLLDERQRAERDAAHRFSQQTMGVLLLTVFVVVAVVTINEPLDMGFPSTLALPLLWVLTMVHVSLPACYLAWTQPAEPVDDTDEPDEN